MKVTIPTSLDDITVGQYIDYNRVLKEQEHDEDVLTVALVAIFCKISVEDALKITPSDLKDIAKSITEVLNSQPKDIEIYNELGRIPNLDDITAGEYIDLDKFLSDPELYGKAMAVFYRPIKQRIGKSYTIVPYTGQEADRRDLPLSLLMSTLVFFWNLSSDLLTATKGYLQRMGEAERSLLEKHLGANGVGINQFIQSLEATTLTLTELLKPTYISS